jgi:hypothetical protein
VTNLLRRASHSGLSSAVKIVLTLEFTIVELPYSRLITYLYYLEVLNVHSTCGNPISRCWVSYAEREEFEPF